MSIEAANLAIGAFARAAGVNVETVRFYQRRGLLAEPDRPYGGIRRYGAADVARVQFSYCCSTMAPSAPRRRGSPPCAWPTSAPAWRTYAGWRRPSPSWRRPASPSQAPPPAR